MRTARAAETGRPLTLLIVIVILLVATASLLSPHRSRRVLLMTGWGIQSFELRGVRTGRRVRCDAPTLLKHDAFGVVWHTPFLGQSLVSDIGISGAINIAALFELHLQALTENQTFFCRHHLVFSMGSHFDIPGEYSVHTT